jgi:hypothetical protein
MIVSLFLRHIRIFKGINFIPLSEGCGFSSLIGENGVGKSSVLESIDLAINKRSNSDWPINNEAKLEGGLGGSNSPFIAPIFLIKKSLLRQTKKEDSENFEKAVKLSNFFWNTRIKTKSSTLDEFYLHREQLKNKFSENKYLLILIGKKYNESGIYFGSYHSFIGENIEQDRDGEYEIELQKLYKGFYDYIISHYSFIYIPVETDIQTYTKLETQDMQKLMNKNIQSAIENAIKPATLKQINKDLDNFVREIEGVLEVYEYKGHFKNNLTMPDLVSKIIEAYFSIKILNKKTDDGNKRLPVSELSSGEKRKALIDVAYSFLLKNDDRDSNIILAIDEPEVSLHISACYSQFEKLIKIGRKNHQILISTHWYGYLPIVSDGSATSIQKNESGDVTVKYYDLYNYREHITQARKSVRGPLPADYSIKSYNDLVQSIVSSVIQEKSYKWIICEGLSEKIYFEEMFKKEITENNFRILPVGSYKEVRKIYNLLCHPMQDTDYSIKGKVVCLIDTDKQRVEVDYKKSDTLKFFRLINLDGKSNIVDVNSDLTSPETEIEDCLNPSIFYQALLEFSEEDIVLKNVLLGNVFNENSKTSASFIDLRETEKINLKNFFDGNDGFNKVRFAKKYTELMRTEYYSNAPSLEWINSIKDILLKE